MKIPKFFFKFGLLKDYFQISNFHYLRRLKSSRAFSSVHYASPKDKAQFGDAGGRQIWVDCSFKGSGYTVGCTTENYIESRILRDGVFALGILNAAYMRLMQRPGILIDVGANVGAFLLPLACAVRGLDVIAIEANPDAIDRLNRNLVANRIGNVRIVAAAAGPEAGEMKMQVPADASADLGSGSLVASAVRSGSYREITVPIRTLDEISDGLGQPVSLIKIDVQGFEVEVLNGAKEIISRDRPVLVFEHEDINFSSEKEASIAKLALKEILDDMSYVSCYVARNESGLMIEVDWGKSLNGDVIAWWRPT